MPIQNDPHIAATMMGGTRGPPPTSYATLHCLLDHVVADASPGGLLRAVCRIAAVVDERGGAVKK